jgi:hypothetical protein
MTGASGHDRRRSTRHAAADLPPGTTIRLRAGHDAVLLNVSRHGILLESPTRLNPGQRCSLHWLGPSAPASTAGVVVRAQLAHRDTKQQLVYRAAIEFAEPFQVSWEVTTHEGNALLGAAEVSGAAAGSRCPPGPVPKG